MEITGIKIVRFSNTNFFVYNVDTLEVIIAPNTLDEFTVTTTVLYENFAVVERSSMEGLMVEFEALGLQLKIDEYIK